MFLSQDEIFINNIEKQEWFISFINNFEPYIKNYSSQQNNKVKDALYEQNNNPSWEQRANFRNSITKY